MIRELNLDGASGAAVHQQIAEYAAEFPGSFGIEAGEAKNLFLLLQDGKVLSDRHNAWDV
jgi:hypothetical protein